MYLLSGAISPDMGTCGGVKRGIGGITSSFARGPNEQ